MATPCNEVTARYQARSAWVATSADEVGVYFATKEGVIFTRVPAKVFADVFLARLDANRNPMPVSSDTSTVANRFSALQEQHKALVEEAAALRQSLVEQQRLNESLHTKIAEKDQLINRDLADLEQRVRHCEAATAHA